MELVQILNSNSELVSSIVVGVLVYLFKRYKDLLKLSEVKRQLKEGEAWGQFALGTLEDLNVALRDDRLTKAEMKEIIENAWKRYSEKVE